MVDCKTAAGPNDVLTFEIADGQQLTAITLTSYTDENNNPIDDRFFFGIHDDVVFPVDEFDMLSGNAVGNEFLGGLLLGDVIGVNMLPQIGNNNVFIGTGFTGAFGSRFLHAVHAANELGQQPIQP